MYSVRDIAAQIIDREGGYVNDPDDPGGPTKYGVTLGTMVRLGMDLSGDGRIDARDVKRLTPEQATEIFVDHYFIRPGLDKLPEILQPSVFDMYVNAGNNAIRVLQRLLNDMGHRLAVDGILGPKHDFRRDGRGRGRTAPYRGCLRDCPAKLLLRPCRSP